MKKLLLVLLAFFAFSGFAFAAVDLNTASKEELDGLKGVGPVKAQAIVDYRKKNGPFRSVDDLKSVKGFGDKTVDKLRAEVTVGGGTPAKAEKKADVKADKKADAKPEAKSETAKADAKTDKKEMKADKKEMKAEKRDSKADKKDAKADKK